MRLLVVDNYDSFTWNLVAAFERLGARTRVEQHDAASAAELAGGGDDAIVLSPGPCTPRESFASLALAAMAVRGELAVPLLGVCLGHQAIGAASGARVVAAEQPLHGETVAIHHDGTGMYASIPQPFDAARYNSLVLERESLPPDLIVSSWTERGEVMGVRHARFAVEGVQFHPESFLTAEGQALLARWLDGVTRHASAA